MSMSLSHNKTVTKPYVLILCHFENIIHFDWTFVSFHDDKYIYVIPENVIHFD